MPSPSKAAVPRWLTYLCVAAALVTSGCGSPSDDPVRRDSNAAERDKDDGGKSESPSVKMDGGTAPALEEDASTPSDASTMADANATERDMKEISAFSINGVGASIVGSSIGLTLPVGTDVSSLTPTITYVGATLDPPSGIAQSFVAPVVYTVTAEDGSRRAYTAAVSVAKSDAKAIEKFTMFGIDASITQTDITLTVPSGSDVTNVAPTIVFKGADVSPASGEPKNFSSPVKYTITAEDGSTKSYTATVTVAPNTPKAIHRFTILDFDADINGTSISLDLPVDTNLTKLTPTIIYVGTFLEPPSGVAQNFVGPVEYVVTASDGSTRTYTVNVKATANDPRTPGDDRPDVVSCGSTTDGEIACDLATHSCCPHALSAVCEIGTTCANSGRTVCDGSEHCGGKACCLNPSSGVASCSSQKSCGLGVTQLCHRKQECPPAKECIPASLLSFWGTCQ